MSIIRLIVYPGLVISSCKSVTSIIFCPPDLNTVCTWFNVFILATNAYSDEMTPYEAHICFITVCQRPL